MTTLAATIKASIAATLTNASDMGTVTHDFIEAFSLGLSDGTGANQANNVWCDERTLAASTAENLDLAGGLTNGFGTALTFTAIKAILIIASAANTNNVQVGGHATAAFAGPFMDVSDKISLKPGGAFLYLNPSAAGDAVTATTGDLLKIENSGSGTGVTYRIVIIGEA